MNFVLSFCCDSWSVVSIAFYCLCLSMIQGMEHQNQQSVGSADFSRSFWDCQMSPFGWQSISQWLHWPDHQSETEPSLLKVLHIIDNASRKHVWCFPGVGLVHSAELVEHRLQGNYGWPSGYSALSTGRDLPCLGTTLLEKFCQDLIFLP